MCVCVSRADRDAVCAAGEPRGLPQRRQDLGHRSSLLHLRGPHHLYTHPRPPAPGSDQALLQGSLPSRIPSWHPLVMLTMGKPHQKLY